MEPDGHEELPAPTGVTINLNPDRVISKLQQRAAVLVQNLQWELATRDALVEVLEERLHESEQLREEAEGAIDGYIEDSVTRDKELHAAEQALEESRLQVAKLVKGEADLLEKIETLTNQLSETGRPSSAAPAQRDAFLELAPPSASDDLEIDRTERLPAVSSSPTSPPASS